MTPTHTDITRAMFAASVAIDELRAADLDDAVKMSVVVLMDALRMACDRLNALEAAEQYKGWKN
jgi:hypothetical protein